MDQVNNFWEVYNSIVTTVLSPLVDGDGETAENIVAAETKLEIKLPGLLREFYLKTANRDDINYAHEVLVGVDRLYFQDNYLVFYEENQCVVFWGISRNNLGDNDPKVLRGVFTSENAEDADWSEDDALPLSEFLISMLIFQIDVLSPGVRRQCRCDRNSTKYPSNWNHCVCHFDGRSEVYWKAGSMIRIYSVGKRLAIVGIGRTEADVADMATTFGIEWTSD